MLIIPSLEWVTNPTNGKQKYKYIPKPRSNSNNFKPGCMDNHPKSIPEALNQYYALKDSGNVEALNEFNELYNKPKKYQQDPGHYPMEGPTVAQGYYTQVNDQEDDSDESDSDNWDGRYFPPRDDDEQFGDADYFEY